jgi:hypothetical protein
MLIDLYVEHDLFLCNSSFLYIPKTIYSEILQFFKIWIYTLTTPYYLHFNLSNIIISVLIQLILLSLFLYYFSIFQLEKYYWNETHTT